MTKSKLLFAILFALVLTSCASIRAAEDAGKKVETSVLHLGMSKAEVQKALNKKPDNIIAARNYPETNTFIEVVQYTEWGSEGLGTDAVAKRIETYWLYFVNDKLDRWETAKPDKKPFI